MIAVAPSTNLPTPLRYRSQSMPALTAVHRVDGPVDGLETRPLTLTQKRNVFAGLVRKSRDYRHTMVPSWVHSYGNGALSGCFVGLLSNIGGFSPAQSFMAYALVESGQMLLYGVLNVYGAHRRDQARGRAGAPVEVQRAECKTELGRVALADAVLGAALVSAALLLRSANAGILPLLLGTRLLMTCKNSYELNLFTCLRQLGRDPVRVAQARSAGQALLGMEMLVSTSCYHMAALGVQYMFLTSAATTFVPLTVAAVIIGTCVTALPKIAVAFDRP